jgi:hypothetical protein
MSRVKLLKYELDTGKLFSFECSKILKDDTPKFSVELNNNNVTFKMKENYDSVNEAKKIVDKYLEAWKVKITLDYRIPNVQFIFKNCEIEKDDGNKMNQRQITSTISAATKKVEPDYPLPPKKFTVTNDVRSMWERYKNYLQNKEALQSMAYFCLTVLLYRFKTLSKSKHKAAEYYRIHEKVLKKISKLTSIKGSSTDARKKTTEKYDQLTDNEKKWLEEAIKTIILRAAAISEIPKDKLRKITMNDLPEI